MLRDELATHIEEYYEEEARHLHGAVAKDDMDYVSNPA